MTPTMPGDAEAAAAAAHLHKQTPRPMCVGAQVRCPRAFGCGHQVGTVHSIEQDQHLGLVYLVDTQEGRLRMLPDECEVIR